MHEDATPAHDAHEVAVDRARLGSRSGVVTAEAYERHAAEIHGFLRRLVRDQEVAADLTAETFMKLLVEEHAGRAPELLRPWLFRVASNLATSRGRRVQVALKAAGILRGRQHEASAPSPEHEVLGRERDRDLHEALGHLGVDARAALLLAAQGYDGVAIAELTGRSHTATRALLFRARRRLRATLREQAFE